MAQLIIRKAEEKDIDQMEVLEQECFSVPWSREALMGDLLENRLSLYLVAELEGNIVGYVGIWNIVDEGHINNVAVSSLYRKQHIGTILIDTLIKATEKAGIKRHTLEVRESNQAAKGLYAKMGFEPAGIRKGYYEDNGEDAIIMWRNSEAKL